MTKIQKEKAVAIVRHYLYAAVVALGVAIQAGCTSPRDLALAALVGLLGPIAAATDPKNPAFGFGSNKEVNVIANAIAKAIIDKDTLAKKK